MVLRPGPIYKFLPEFGQNEAIAGDRLHRQAPTGLSRTGARPGQWSAGDEIALPPGSQWRKTPRIAECLAVQVDQGYSR